MGRRQRGSPGPPRPDSSSPRPVRAWPLIRPPPAPTRWRAGGNHSNTAWTFRRPRTSKKHALADPGPSDGLTEAVTAVFSGTSVISGLGKAVVMKTGPATEFGRVAAGLVGRHAPETERERGARRFGFLILEIVIFLVLFVFLVNGP